MFSTEGLMCAVKHSTNEESYLTFKEGIALLAPEN